MLLFLIIFNTKIEELYSKIPDLSGLVKKTHYHAQMLEIEGKYFINFDHNKFMSDLLDGKIKQKELVNQSDISNSDLNTKLLITTKAELKAGQDKIVQLQEFDPLYFYDNFFFCDDGLQNMFAYQAIFHTLELKKARVLNMLLIGNQKTCIILDLHNYMVLSYLT